MRTSKPQKVFSRETITALKAKLTSTWDGFRVVPTFDSNNNPAVKIQSTNRKDGRVFSTPDLDQSALGKFLSSPFNYRGRVFYDLGCKPTGEKDENFPVS